MVLLCFYKKCARRIYFTLLKITINSFVVGEPMKVPGPHLQLRILSGEPQTSKPLQAVSVNQT